MNAAIALHHIERRISPDPVSDAEWLRTKLQGNHIVQSQRYSDGDIAKYGLKQVKQWIAEDHRRLAGLDRGEWEFMDLELSAVATLTVGQQDLGQVKVLHSCVGGIESDCGEYLDELTRELADEMLHELHDMGFAANTPMPIVDVVC